MFKKTGIAVSPPEEVRLCTTCGLSKEQDKSTGEWVCRGCQAKAEPSEVAAPKEAEREPR